MRTQWVLVNVASGMGVSAHMGTHVVLASVDGPAECAGKQCQGVEVCMVCPRPVYRRGLCSGQVVASWSQAML